MIDLARMHTQCAEWGISPREWMELQAEVYGNVDVFGDIRVPDDPQQEEFRGSVAQVLIDNDLHHKARRYIECCRYGIRLQCKGPEKHDLFALVRCDLRFCPYCGPRQFARLIDKYAPVVRFLARQPRRGYALRQITLTTRNIGLLTSAQIEKFNEDVKATLKRVTEGYEGWGALWSDEVGFNNTNLHAHILFYGPFIEWEHLREVWKEISGSHGVYISKSRAKGTAALRYLLKYVSKPPSDNPEIVGQLEVAFHGRRRVHTLGIFYNFAPEEDCDHDLDPWKTCPHCGAELKRQPGTVRLENLIMEGRTFIGANRPKEKRTWVN